MPDNDMYYDPAAFNFDALVDVIEDAPENVDFALPKVSELTADGGYTDDISDLSDLELGSDEPKEPDYNADVNDLLTPEATDPAALDTFNQLSASDVIDFEGVQMTKADVIGLLKEKNDLTSKKAYIDDVHHNMREIDNYVNQKLAYSETAVDQNIAFLERVLSNPALNGDEYKKYSLELHNAKQAKQNVLNQTQEITQRMAQMKQNAIRERVITTDAEMQSTYPEWLQIRNYVVNDAFARGVDPAALDQVWGKGMAEILVDAYKYRQNKARLEQKARQTATEAQAARSTKSTQTAQRQKIADERAAKKSALINKMKKGGLTPAEHTKMFDFLVD
ncbi:hypothetical protein MXL54_08380 [Enterobacteriaceae bacterium G50]|nr:hypothetical protein [Enterobacteriaceae bacterium G50]